MALMQFAQDHVETYIRTRGEIGHMFDSRPFTEGKSGLATTLLLKVRGRKSGKPHIFPLQYMKYGAGYLVVASNGGNDKDPNWYLNLCANVVTVIQVKDRVFRAPGYVLPGEQRDDAWAALIAEHPWFIDYQARTNRQFPLVLLTPIDPLESILSEAPLETAAQSLNRFEPARVGSPLSALDPRLQKLIDKDEIYECWINFCRGVDRLDPELMRQAYHDDAVEDHGGFVGPADDFVPWAQKLVRDVFASSMHLITNFSCDIDGDAAHVEFYYLSLEQPHDGPRHIRGGRYLLRFEKRDGRWAVADGVCLIDCDDTQTYSAEGADTSTACSRPWRAIVPTPVTPAR